jgi:hypothetical protein
MRDCFPRFLPAQRAKQAASSVAENFLVAKTSARSDIPPFPISRVNFRSRKLLGEWTKMVDENVG